MKTQRAAPFAGVPYVERPALEGVASAVSRGEATDADLVRDVASGEHGALAEVYERHGASVLGLAQHVCGLRDADDVVQEVFLRLWREPQGFDAQRGSLRSFLLVMTRFRAIDVVRANSARQGREERFASSAEPERQELDLELIDQEHRALIADAVDGLSDDVRNAIRAAFYGRWTYAGAAVALGVPEGTVKARIRSGLRQLRDPLAELLVADEP